MSTELSTNVRAQDMIFRTSQSAAQLSLPAHIVEAMNDAATKNEGVEELKGYVRPSRVKVCQSNRTGGLKSFKEGSVVLTPANILVAENDEPFWFVPLLFFPEYLTLNPWALKATLPFVRARSLDPMSEIAKKARDKDLRKSDVCPEDPQGKEMLTHVESLTFIAVIVGQPMPVAFSFQRGEYKIGSQLANQITMRGGPCYGMVFEAFVPEDKRSNDRGEWYGINIGSPSTGDAPSPWVQDAREFRQLQTMHRDLKAKLREEMIQIDHDYDDDEEAAAPNEAASTI